MYNTLTVPCEKSKTFCGSLIMKNIVVFPVQARFPVKLIYCITLGLASSAYCLFKFIAIILQCLLK